LLDQHPGANGRSKVVFYLDTRTEKLPVLFRDANRVIMFDPLGQTVCELDSERSRVRIVAPERRWSPRLTLMRFVRERAMRAVLEQSSLLLHAAGYAVGGRAVLIAGRKRSGKSSLLLHALNSGVDATDASPSANDRLAVRYLSNDRTALLLDGARIEARGLPTILSLRTSTLELFPHTRARIEKSGFFPALTRREAGRYPLGVARPWRGSMFTLSPAQLCELTGVDAAPSAPLGAILFPNVSSKRGGIRITRLKKAEAFAQLQRALFRADHRVQVGPLFSHSARGPGMKRAELATRLSALVEQVGCYSCELGLQAYQDDAWLGRTLELIGRP